MWTVVTGAVCYKAINLHYSPPIPYPSSSSLYNARCQQGALLSDICPMMGHLGWHSPVGTKGLFPHSMTTTSALDGLGFEWAAWHSLISTWNWHPREWCLVYEMCFDPKPSNTAVVDAIIWTTNIPLFHSVVSVCWEADDKEQACPPTNPSTVVLQRVFEEVAIDDENVYAWLSLRSYRLLKLSKLTLD